MKIILQRWMFSMAKKKSADSNREASPLSSTSDWLPRLTIAQIAERAGVSNATVSRVFHEDKYVAEATREKVLAALRELEAALDGQNKRGFIRDDKAANHHTFISFTSITMGSDYAPLVIDGLVEGVHERGARPIICPLAHRHNADLTIAERLIVTEVSGGLIIGSTDDPAELLALSTGGFPLVLIDPYAGPIEKLPLVTIAHWHNARIATEHMLSLGHQHIALLTDQRLQQSTDHYLAGFQAALQSARLPLDPASVLLQNELSVAGGYQAACRMLDLPQRPTAIVTSSDILAAGVLQAARERNLSVPADLSIIGSDDLPFASMLSPALTTISQPYEAMGRVAVDMLFRIITRGIFESTRIELVGNLVVRGTTAAPVQQKSN